ncbi:MAG TPA: GAF domain-containing sensor histidine kinase [Baekduia sp.]|uniref:GAF domain-containing sensor histidine kinase n=1 Tax=Baekduia sp. TaxID=2600305 RepID=UPI002D78256C|nr:GAF domain-containing sensor histidine kinase [Baekduia sp.]HET6508108.1 GAF domain-containing sensor histidine kinase [Baekduia sp.]
MPDAGRLDRLAVVARELVSELDLEEVLERLLETARELTGSPFAALGVLNAARDGLERFVERGISDERRALIGDPPRGRGVLGLLIDDPRPLRLDDVRGHPLAFGTPSEHPVITTFLGVPITVGDEAWGNLYLSNKPGGFTDEDEWTAIVLARWAAVAIENARLYEGIDQRRHDLERAVARLRASTEIAIALGAEVDREPILELVVKRARALVDARGVAVLLEAPGGLVVGACAGEVTEPPGPGHVLPIEGTRWGEVLARGEAQRIDDVAADGRLDPAPLGAPDAATALLVPLSYRRRTLGVLVAFDRRDARGDASEDGFGSRDADLLRAFASSAAIAVVTAETVEKSRLRTAIEAAEAERGRWARELHDETLQSLGGLLVLLASAHDGDEAQLRATTEQAVEHLADEIAGLRSIIAELRPAALDELGLAPALRALVRRAAGGAGLEAATYIALDEDTRPAPELETAVYRVAQEALTNVAKHAHASRVSVRLASDDGELVLTIADDGNGFDPTAPSPGFGVAGMRERVGLVGGTLQIEPSPDGTILRAAFADPSPAVLPPPPATPSSSPRSSA